MFGRIFTILTVVTLLELAVLIPLGNWMGFWPTILLVIATAWFGSFLIRREGRKALHDMQVAAEKGTVASDAIVDGVIVLISGILLMTPGVLSDFVALMLLIPAVRGPLRDEVRKRARAAASNGTFRFSAFGGGMGGGGFGPGGVHGGGARGGGFVNGANIRGDAGMGGPRRTKRPGQGDARNTAGASSRGNGQSTSSTLGDEPRVFDDTFVD